MVTWKFIEKGCFVSNDNRFEIIGLHDEYYKELYGRNTDAKWLVLDDEFFSPDCPDKRIYHGYRTAKECKEAVDIYLKKLEKLGKSVRELSWEEKEKIQDEMCLVSIDLRKRKTKKEKV